MQTLLKNTRAYKLLAADGKNDRFGHAYLVLLDDARNLRAALKTFAKPFFGCEERRGESAARIADLIDSESFADCHFFPEKDKKLVVEDAERIAEECMLRPVEGEKKLFVVCGFDEATVAAQNKLLKLLEEPPKGVFFLLGACVSYPVLPTVLSRVQKLEIPPFDNLEIAACLAREYGADFSQTDYALCAAASGGCLGSARDMLFGGAYKTLIDDAFSLCLGGSASLPALVKRVGETKRKKELLSLLRLVFRDALVYKTSAAKADRTFLRAEEARIKSVAERYTARALIEAQTLIAQAERESFFNAVFPQCLETLIAKIYEIDA
ncbi:MAG: hypothetical protein IJ514_07330 [Clostridia bacterium]|nr:hypothetical protein [Clostridia bacterium]